MNPGTMAGPLAPRALRGDDRAMTQAVPAARIQTIDAARGVALLGILLINIISFALPSAAYIHPLAWGDPGPLDRGVWALNQLLFEGRMRGLFALMFGASALLVMERAARAGETPALVHLRRMLVLALIGLAHLVLVWDGDVLLHYGVIGLLLIPFAGRSTKTLTATAATVLLIHTMFFTLAFLWSLHMVRTGMAPGAPAAAAAEARGFLASLPGPDDATVARDLALYRGDYAGIVAYRWDMVGGHVGKLLSMLGAETFGYMLLGMALYRGGLFDPARWPAARLKRLAIRCYAVSLPVLAALTAWEIGSGYDPVVIMGHFLGWSVPFRVLCAIGHLALAVWLFRRFPGAALTRRLAAVGRMALSNYLATSIVMTTVFYGYGLGLYGSVPRAALYLFVFAMWALLLAWSQPWLANYRFGPVEWLWRSLARGRIQPMRGSAT